MQKQQHIAVVGAGIIGVCTAFQLQIRGFKVTLIDKQGVAQGCSKGNAGHFATEQVFPLAHKSLIPHIPKMLLAPLGPFRIHWPYLFKALPWFLRFVGNMKASKFQHNLNAIKALNSIALSSYIPLLELTDSQSQVKLNGSLLTFEHNNLDEIKKIHQSYIEQGVAVELLDQAATLEKEPALSKDVKASLFFSDVGHTVDPESLCKTFAQYLLNIGTTIKQANVVDIIPDNKQYKVQTSEEDLRFDKVVIATGAWAKKLINIFGYKVPLETERGYHLMLPNKKLFSRPVASSERKFIMTPMQDGLRLAGTVEFAGLATPANPTRAEILLPHANHLIENFNVSLEDDFPRWMGHRPSLPDSLPVIGEAPKHKNLYFAFGHQHLGLTWGAITGQLIAELASNKEPIIDVKPYCISRFN